MEAKLTTLQSYPSVAAAVSALSREECLAIATDMRAAACDPEAITTLLRTYPTLTVALLMIEERLQMLRTTTPPLDAAIAAHAAQAAAVVTTDENAEEIAMMNKYIQFSDEDIAALIDEDEKAVASAVKRAATLSLREINSLSTAEAEETRQIRERLIALGLPVNHT